MINRKKQKPTEGVFTANWIPYGYMYSPAAPNGIVVDPETREYVKYIFEAYITGKPRAQICADLTKMGAPSPSKRKEQLGYEFRNGHANEYWPLTTLNFFLINPMYIGDYVDGDITIASYQYINHAIPEDAKLPNIIHDHHEAIISKELYIQAATLYHAQKEFRSSSQKKSNSLPPTPFFNLFHCGICGRQMYRAQNVTKKLGCYSAYVCSSYRLHLPDACPKKLYPLNDLIPPVHKAILQEFKLSQKLASQVGEEKSIGYKKTEAYFQSQIDIAVDAVRQNSVACNQLENRMDKGKITLEEYNTAKTALDKEAVDFSALVVTALENIRTFRKICSHKNKWLQLFSDFDEDFVITRKTSRKYLKRINLYPDKPMEIIFQESEERDKLQEYLSLQKGKGSGRLKRHYTRPTIEKTEE